MEPQLRSHSFVDQLQREADKLDERVKTVYRRVGRPACGAPAGLPCTRLGAAGARSRTPLKHPHRERLRADGLADR